MSRPRNSSASCNTNQYAVRELAITSVTREVVIHSSHWSCYLKVKDSSTRRRSSV